MLRCSVCLAVLSAAVLGAPAPAHASRAADEAFAAEASQVLASNEAELVRLRAEIGFLSERLESSHAAEALLLLDDSLIREALLERAEAELADAQMAEAYLDQHPRRVGSLARVAAAGEAVDRGAREAMETREMRVEMLEAHQAALLEALEQRGQEPDTTALEAALHQGIAEPAVARVGLQVEVDRYRELREAGDDTRLVLALPEEVGQPARHLSRQLTAARTEDMRQSQAYGDRHPSKEESAGKVERIGEQLASALDLAVRTEVTRLKLLWAQQQALEERLDQLER